jgi:EF hand
MWRFAAGVCSGLILMTAGAVLWQSLAQADASLVAPPRSTNAGLSAVDVSPPLEATEKSREERRFGRYDRDRNGAVSREEYLQSRRKNYAKLDANADGVLSFEEYATKTTAKFASADQDKTGALTPKEFLATRVVRKMPLRDTCPPPRRGPAIPDPESDDG